MQIKLPCGAVLICDNQKIAEQHLKYGAVEVKPVVKQEVPITVKKAKKTDN